MKRCIALFLSLVYRQGDMSNTYPHIVSNFENALEERMCHL